MPHEETLPDGGLEPKTKKSLTDTVKLEASAVTMLNMQARKLKVPKSTYASAAIRYFAENGLNPTNTTSISEGAKTRADSVR